MLRNYFDIWGVMDDVDPNLLKPMSHLLLQLGLPVWSGRGTGLWIGWWDNGGEDKTVILCPGYKEGGVHLYGRIVRRGGWGGFAYAPSEHVVRGYGGGIDRHMREAMGSLVRWVTKHAA